MALVSTGFTGTVDETESARIMSLAGNRYAVGGPSDFRVSPVAGVRSVVVAPGAAYAAGWRVDSDASVVLPLTTPTAGRSYLICLSRSWSTHNASLVVVDGANTTSTAPAYPPSVLPAIASVPGVLDDQPLAWVWSNAGSTTVLVFDLRPHSGITSSPYATAVGQVTVPILAANAGTGGMSITFPVGRFTIPPVLTISAGSGRLSGWYGKTTATGANIGADNWSNAPSERVTLSWVATQMTSTSAIG